MAKLRSPDLGNTLGRCLRRLPLTLMTFAVAAGSHVACEAPCEDTLTCDVGNDAGEGGATGASSGGATGVGGEDGLSLGEACSQGDECASGICTDDRCCDVSCDGLCEACDVVDVEGTCSPVAPAEDPDSECEGVCDGSRSCAEGAVVGGDRYGSANGFALGSSAASSAAQTVFSGTFSGSLPLGVATLTSSGFEDGFVVGLDASGAPAWTQQIGGNGASVFDPQVALDEAGNTLGATAISATVQIGFETITPAGGFAITVFKLSPIGGLQWARGFGDGTSEIRIASAPNGAVVVAGQLSGTVDFGGGILAAGGDAAYVGALDLSGNHVWSTTIPTTGGTVRVSEVLVRPDGNVLVVGSFSGVMNFAGTNSASNGLEDIFVAELSSSGVPLSISTFGDTQADRATAAALGEDGSLQLLGLFSGSIDFGGGQLVAGGGGNIVTARLGPDGAHMWSKVFVTPTGVEARDVEVDASGNAVLVGKIDIPVDFGGGAIQGSSDDWFVAKYAQDGTHLWSYRLGGPADEQEARAVAVRPDEIVVLGDFSGTIPLDTGSLTAQGEYDLGVVRLLP